MARTEFRRGKSIISTVERRARADVGPPVMDQGVFKAPFADLQPPRRNAEVGVNLPVRSEEAGAQALECGAHMRFVVEMSLEFEVEQFHRCKASHGRKLASLPGNRDQMYGKPLRPADSGSRLGRLARWVYYLIAATR